MNGPLIAAGSIAVIGAAIHGVAGDILVLRKVLKGALPATVFGGTQMTKTMVLVTWHFVTITFLTFGVALLLSGTVLDGDAARGISVVVGAACTAFWVVALAVAAAYTRSPRFVILHPAPVLLSVVVALVWWGVL